MFDKLNTVRLQSVNNNVGFDMNGRALFAIGNQELHAGDYVLTDGNVIYGNKTIHNGGLPIYNTSKGGYPWLKSDKIVFLSDDLSSFNNSIDIPPEIKIDWICTANSTDKRFQKDIVYACINNVIYNVTSCKKIGEDLKLGCDYCVSNDGHLLTFTKGEYLSDNKSYKHMMPPDKDSKQDDWYIKNSGVLERVNENEFKQSHVFEHMYYSFENRKSGINNTIINCYDNLSLFYSYDLSELVKTKGNNYRNKLNSTEARQVFYESDVMDTVLTKYEHIHPNRSKNYISRSLKINRAGYFIGYDAQENNSDAIPIDLADITSYYISNDKQAIFQDGFMALFDYKDVLYKFYSVQLVDDDNIYREHPEYYVGYSNSQILIGGYTPSNLKIYGEYALGSPFYKGEDLLYVKSENGYWMLVATSNINAITLDTNPRDWVDAIDFVKEKMGRDYEKIGINSIAKKELTKNENVVVELDNCKIYIDKNNKAKLYDYEYSTNAQEIFDVFPVKTNGQQIALLNVKVPKGKQKYSYYFAKYVNSKIEILSEAVGENYKVPTFRIGHISDVNRLKLAFKTLFTKIRLS